MNPLVSIVVNNYNYGQFIEQAIDSALRQTYAPTEILVVDDGSTDNSRKIIGGFGSKIVSILKENEGQASTFNAGFSMSRGEIVIFLDADDFLFPTAVADAVPLFADSNVVKVHWPLWEVDEAGENTHQLHTKSLIEGNYRQEFIERGPISLPQSPTSGNAWARWFLEQVIPLPEHEDKHGADGFLKKLCPVFGEIRRLEEPHGCYRIHRANYGGGRDEMFKLRRGLNRYATYCRLLEKHLRRMGIDVDSRKWMGSGSQYAWLSDAVTVQQEITPLIPPGSKVVLVDDNAFGAALLPQCSVVPLIESHGEYGGAPSDERHAIQAFESLRQVGAAYLAFTFPALWWVDYYAGFVRYLNQEARCIFKNERIVLYDLKQGPLADQNLGLASRECAEYKLRTGLLVAEVCKDALGNRPNEIVSLGEGSNDCSAFKVRVGDRCYKCYECSSPDRALMAERASRMLESHGVAIPRIHRIVDHVVLAEWVDGHALTMPLKTKTFKQWIAYQAQIHGIPVDYPERTRPRFVHLEWLIQRMLQAGAKYVALDQLERLGQTLRLNIPANLKCGIVHPDFIPANVVLTPAGSMVVIDNEFLGCDVGFEFDILNTSYSIGGGDESRRQLYLDAYAAVGDCGTLREHQGFWEMCYLVKVIGKQFLMGDVGEGRKCLQLLEQRMGEFEHRLLWQPSL